MEDVAYAGIEAPTILKTDVNEEIESEEVRAKKKAKRAPLHEEYSAPLSFLEDAVTAAQNDILFNTTQAGKHFGAAKEAYVRPCYEEIVQAIAAQLPTGKATQIIKDDMKKKLFIIRGSPGIGKSTFLAYFLVRFRNYFGKTILCHTGKSLKGSENDNAVCQVWEGGLKVLEGFFGQLKYDLDKHMSTTTLIVLDGCSLPIDLTGFRGTMIIAASPSLYLKNLQDAVIISNCKSFTMPALNLDEALAIAAMIGVEEDVVKTNFCFMRGIARYLFEPGIAKAKVEDAVKQVDASAITRMVSMQVTSKAAELFMVHSLVLWMADDYHGDPQFELVSPYAEPLVAKKLALETAVKLKEARQSLAPLSGAEGYARALFEAYAIRTLQAGGTFAVQGLSGKPAFSLQIPPMGDPVVIETNTVSAATVASNTVRIADGPSSFVATLLWPTTTNFPTVDCFYFDTDGNAYSLQMTIAKSHELKNSGAFNAKKYLDGLLGLRDTHPAVFVVPVDIAANFAAQKFEGKVDKRQLDMTQSFDQWVIGI